jgi:hypothetical protein
VSAWLPPCPDDLIEEGAQPATRHQRRIEVTHRSGRRIRGFWNSGSPPLTLGVHPFECAARKIHLAANLDASPRHVDGRGQDALPA